MTQEDFIVHYENAIASQRWDNVAPFIHEKAVITFSNGKRHIGMAAIEEAYSTNFGLIKDEKYSISGVNWVIVKSNMAVYTFNYAWSGILNGKLAKGGGTGTAVLLYENNQWKLLSEHLGQTKKW